MAESEKLVDDILDGEYFDEDGQRSYFKVGNPLRHAGIISKIFFTWMSEVMKTGYRRALDDSDLFNLLERDKTKHLTEKFEKDWDKEIEHSKKKGRKPKLYRAVFHTFKLEWCLVLMIGFVASFGSIIMPAFIGLVIETTHINNYQIHYSYFYGGCLCLFAFITVTFAQHTAYTSFLTGVRLKSACIGLLYKKIIALNQASLGPITTGYVVNLASNDVTEIQMCSEYLHNLILGPAELVGSVLLLWHYMGWATLAGIGFILLLLPYQVGMGTLSGYLRYTCAQQTDKRVKAIKEVVVGIRPVKMYTWEKSFRDDIHSKRKAEMKTIFRKAIILSLQAMISATVGIIASFLTLFTFVLSGHALTAANVFTTVALLTRLKLSIGDYFQYALIKVNEAVVSLQRIQHFFEEAEKYADKYSARGITVAPHERSDEGLKEDEALKIEKITCSWDSEHQDDDHATLKDVTIEAKTKSLTALVGQVGAGKTSVLMSILGELPVISGGIKHRGHVAYLDQQPWIFPGTVRENILFGLKYEEKRYLEVIEACSMTRDIELMPGGDLAVVGERGTKLSGGQRTRVSLARAVYADADIYLIDDPISAVDAKVGKKLFQDCISKALGDKTRILVVHQLHFLANVDYIVVMKHGSIFDQGTYEELAKRMDFDALEEEDKEETTKTEYKEVLEDPAIIDEDEKDLDMATEDREEGLVSWSVYWKYFKAGGSILILILLATFFITAEAIYFVLSWWLAKWTKQPYWEQQDPINIYVYTALVAGSLFFAIVRALLFFHATVKSSENLHDGMVESLLQAPVLFFDTNRIGKILNRFAADIGLMDTKLPYDFLICVSFIVNSLGVVIFISVANFWVIIAVIPLLSILCYLLYYYMRTSTEIRRLEAISRSPVYSHVSTTLEGLVTIRAFGQEDNFLKQIYRFQDINTSATIMSIGCERWLGIRTDMLCSSFLTVVVFSGIATSMHNAGMFAASLAFSMQLLRMLQWAFRLLGRVANMMTSVERVISYTDIPPEPGYGITKLPPDDWPQNGDVVFENMGLRYFEGGKNVLNGINCTIRSEEKIGIVGRTGAGKSSLLAALFRMPEPTGKIYVDNVLINDLNIQSARKIFSVIPQTPFLFSGSLRQNLDPFGKYSDKEIWDILDTAQLKVMVEKMKGMLDYVVQESGSNFSVGERQLMCLARALLHKNKVIVIDEATANVDFETDRLIQETIRSNFGDCTVLTIAHRLNTILDSDRIMVYDAGQLVQFDTPTNLLEYKQGIFAQLMESYQSDVS